MNTYMLFTKFWKYSNIFFSSTFSPPGTPMTQIFAIVPQFPEALFIFFPIYSLSVGQIGQNYWSVFIVFHCSSLIYIEPIQWVPNFDYFFLILIFPRGSVSYITFYFDVFEEYLKLLPVSFLGWLLKALVRLFPPLSHLSVDICWSFFPLVVAIFLVLVWQGIFYCILEIVIIMLWDSGPI